MVRKLFFLLSIIVLVNTFTYASTTANVLSLGAAGVATPQPDTVAVAAPLANLTARTLTSVKIVHIQLSTAKLQTALPINVGTIRGHGSELVQADFDSKSLVDRKS